MIHPRCPSFIFRRPASAAGELVTLQLTVCQRRQRFASALRASSAGVADTCFALSSDHLHHRLPDWFSSKGTHFGRNFCAPENSRPHRTPWDIHRSGNFFVTEPLDLSQRDRLAQIVEAETSMAAFYDLRNFFLAARTVSGVSSLVGSCPRRGSFIFILGTPGIFRNDRLRFMSISAFGGVDGNPATAM